LVNMFAEAFGSQRPHPDDLSLARRLLSHEAAEIIVAGLLRAHLGARPEAQESASALRRSRAPRPLEASDGSPPPAVEEPSEQPRREGGKRRKKDKRKKRRVDDAQASEREHDERGEEADRPADDERNEAGRRDASPDSSKASNGHDDSLPARLLQQPPAEEEAVR